MNTRKYKMINVKDHTWNKIDEERQKENKTWMEFMDKLIGDYIFYKNEWDNILKEHYVISLSSSYKKKNPKLKEQI